MDRSAAVALRRQALAEQASRMDRLRVVHEALLDVLEDPGDARSSEWMSQARRNIRQWQANGTCSPDYVTAWDAILAAPKQGLRALLSDERSRAAMLQNSPFGFLIRTLR